MSNMWLYQISAERWPIGQWRDEMWEGYKNRCRAGRMVGSKDEIEDGDIIVFWYTKTAAKKDFGLYGWATARFNKQWSSIRFVLTTPSNYLKMDPINDEEMEKIVEEIRGNYKRANIFHINDELAKKVRHKIRSYW